MVDRGPPFSALRALEAACRMRSYSLAGDELGVTHSAVSQAVRRLEREYGRTLFRRDGMQMAPSPEALALAQAYREASRLVLRATADLNTHDRQGPLEAA
jgi:LysR family glycine cleavage system transcriptional activator